MREQVIAKAAFYGDFETAEERAYSKFEKIGHDWLVQFIEAGEVLDVRRFRGRKAMYMSTPSGTTSPWARISVAPYYYKTQGYLTTNATGEEIYVTKVVKIRRNFIVMHMSVCNSQDAPYTVGCEYGGNALVITTCTWGISLKYRDYSGGNFIIDPDYGSGNLFIGISRERPRSDGNIAHWTVINLDKGYQKHGTLKVDEQGGVMGLGLWASPFTDNRYELVAGIFEHMPDAIPPKRNVYFTHANGRGKEVGVVSTNRVM